MARLDILATIEFATLAILSIVAVMNPLSTIAIFTTLTSDIGPEKHNSEKHRKIAAKAMKIAFIVLVFFALTGQLLFQVFNIEVYAFQIAGGILLVALALKMLSEKNGLSSEDREDISIIPLVFPLTAGPGSITTVILLFSQAIDFFDALFVFIGITIGILLSYFGMKYAYKIIKVLGVEGLHVVTALMAIIVLAIAIQFIIVGIVDAIPYIPIE
ncbi:MAG: MarC family protein [Candidatus Bathyarchaeota archaeon]|nr:MAG: MarC family protein [Candidatus Bathyarchaeota archaeon]